MQRRGTPKSFNIGTYALLNQEYGDHSMTIKRRPLFGSLKLISISLPTSACTTRTWSRSPTLFGRLNCPRLLDMFGLSRFYGLCKGELLVYQLHTISYDHHHIKVLWYTHWEIFSLQKNVTDHTPCWHGGWSWWYSPTPSSTPHLH